MPRACTRLAAAAALALAGRAAALNNGLGVAPQRGYNSWYDVLMGPSEASLLATAAALKSSGLAALGYSYVNLDDGMVSTARFPNGTLQPDPTGFPRGFRVVSDALHAQGFSFGVYTDRGALTCGGRAAALGNEALDAATYASWGVDYVKVRPAARNSRAPVRHDSRLPPAPRVTAAATVTRCLLGLVSA